MFEPWDNTVMFWENEQWWAMLAVSVSWTVGYFIYCWRHK